MTKYKLPKELVLDYKKWVCGDSTNKTKGTGEGLSKLLNKSNYMCCLGQFSLQTGVKKSDIYDKSCPSSLNFNIVGLSWKKNEETQLAYEAMDINDACDTTIVEKIKRLKQVFSKYKYKIKLKNFPKWVMKEFPNG